MLILLHLITQSRSRTRIMRSWGGGGKPNIKARTISDDRRSGDRGCNQMQVHCFPKDDTRLVAERQNLYRLFRRKSNTFLQHSLFFSFGPSVNDP
jgi:hypothetical protein